MRWRLTLIGSAAVLALAVATTAAWQVDAGGPQNPFRLKEPNQLRACLACHTDFEQKLKKPVVHAAVQMGECSGCHDPHASTHPTLLSANLSEICADCHGSVIPAQAKSTHKVVADGACDTCHDPHASDNASLLVKKGDALCASCHADLTNAVAAAKFKHPAVEMGCQTCHDPHGSDQAGHLLKKAVPDVCVDCHQPDSAAFLERHQRYPVGQASCSSCHDPHGSNQPALLMNNVHAPVGAGGCNRCHDAPTAAQPFATKSRGFELCKGCHADLVNDAMAKARLHWPVADQKGCVNCHNPHASNQAKLLKADTQALCQSCHPDTMRRFATTAVKHAPVEGGMCVACHSPHGSSNPYLIDQKDVATLCGQCHDYESHSAHPLGDKAVDPRNKNLRVDCLSCHKGHGTPFKRMLLADTNVELCTQCHKKFGR